ncbi:MAG: glycoside hydrolase family 65 protein [Candidatus Omnitrophica bacterium]|nr:glycoside hydrolase family 65 protein [Candidatus Omnitrophota bacterium]
MKDFYSDYLKDELWLIRESKWVRPLQNIRESQFALGNGYLGTRAVLEEIPYDAQPGTYIAGLYDKMASQVAELVNLPNPINFKFTCKGEKFDLIAMNSLEHRRVLNMKKGLLIRQTLYSDNKKRRFDYQSLRFVSMHNKNIGALQIVFTPLDTSCVLDINTGIDTSVFNAGVLSEGRKKHFRVKELGQAHKAGFLVAETLEKKQPIVYWSGFYYQIKKKKIYAQDNVFRLKIKKNQTVIFTKIFCIKRFPPHRDHGCFKDETYKIFSKAFRGKFISLLDDHVKAWEKLWRRADILVEATQDVQTNLRFNIYHMLICQHYDYGLSSVGARTLSGEGYRGHVFWDTEIFLMPFYLAIFPQVAKNLLLYRYRRINKARELAKKEGYRGAKIPWESAYTGEEETPAWAKDIDGTVIKIHTHQMEHHITSDVAYAVYKYYVFTGDEKFMEYCGYEIMFESARFWASRVEFNKKKRRYEINNVIGPDEFHIGVNNNAFTNMMAKWNLVTAYKMHSKLKNKNFSLCRILEKNLSLTQREVSSWQRIAARISININKDRVIEQFDGYFKLREVLPKETDESGMPIIPRNIKVRGLKNTQLVKQADVLMLLCLLDDVFDKKTKLANYNFYMPRTVHKSSLSASMHALIASRINDLQIAYNFFTVSLLTDISNLCGNTFEGVHAANLGGTWQTVVFGFAGISLKREKLYINPQMPRIWKGMIFSLIWRQNLIQLELTNDKVKIKIKSKAKKALEIGVFDAVQTLKPNRTYIFSRSRRKYIQDVHY